MPAALSIAQVRLALSALAQAIVCGGAHYAAWETEWATGMQTVASLLLTALVLLALGCLWPWRTAGPEARLAAILTILYGLAFYAANTPLSVQGDNGWRLYLVLLVPLSAASTILTRQGNWLAAAGVMLFLGDAVFALGYNATHMVTAAGCWNGKLY